MGAEFYCLVIGKAIFSIVLFAAAYIDIKKRIIPNKLVLSVIILTFVLNGILCIFNGEFVNERLIGIFAGLLAGGIPLLLTEVTGRLFLKKECVGGGDIKFYGVCGMFLGMDGIIQSYFILAVISIPVLIVLRITKKVKKGEYIPFAPLICSSVFISMISL